jgi:hypothetical protein
MPEAGGSPIIRAVVKVSDGAHGGRTPRHESSASAMITTFGTYTRTFAPQVLLLKDRQLVVTLAAAGAIFAARADCARSAEDGTSAGRLD